MKKKIIIIGAIVVISSLILSGCATTENTTNDEIEATISPFLWQIEGENPSYLYGSIHVPYEKVLTLPDIVMDALDEVDAVYTELEMDAATQTETVQLLVLSNGQTLGDILPQESYDELDSYLTDEGLSITLFETYKIWAITSLLTQLEDIELYMVNPTLDQYIWNTAISKEKETGGIETPEEQAAIFDDLTIEEQTTLLDETIVLMKEYEDSDEGITDELINAYLTGDLQILYDLMYYGFDENDPLDVKLEQSLIIDRNHIMVERIIDLITDNPDTQYFFCVGAGHYFGDEGILELMEDEGYTVTQVPFEESSECDSGEININGKCYYPYDN